MSDLAKLTRELLMLERHLLDCKRKKESVATEIQQRLAEVKQLIGDATNVG